MSTVPPTVRVAASVMAVAVRQRLLSGLLRGGWSGTGFRCGRRVVRFATGRANASPSMSSHSRLRMRVAYIPSAMQW